MKTKITLILTSVLCFSFTACTPKGDTPAFDNSPQSNINFEACRNTSLTFKVVTAEKVRSLVNCLSSNNKSLLPLKDYLDSAATEDLDLVFDAFTRHMPWGSPRHTQFLDLIKLTKQRGYLKGLLKNFQVLASSQTIVNGINAALPLWENNSVDHPDINLERVNEYLVRAIDNKLSDRILTSSEILNSPRARAMAELVSRDFVGGLNSDQITDSLSDSTLNLIADGSFHSIFTHGGQPALIKLFKKTIGKDRDGFADTLKYFMVNKAASGFSAFKRAQSVLRATDMSMEFFFTKTNRNVRRADNINRFMIDEIKNKSQSENDGFLLKTVPLLLVSTGHVCQLPQDMIANYDVITDLATSGYSEAFVRFWNVFDLSGRFDLLMRSLKSNHMVEFAPVLGEYTRRSGLRMGLDLIGDDLKESDVSVIQQLMTSMSVGNISGSSLNTWIQRSFDKRGKASTASVLNQLANQLAAPQKNLENLVYKVEGDSRYDKESASLRSALSGDRSTMGVDGNFAVILQKIFRADGDQRNTLKALNKSLVKVWADSRGGIGETIKIISDVSHLTVERPTAEFIRDILADKDLVNRTSPAFIRLVKNPKFAPLINRSGELAGTGDLERLIVFFVDLLRGDGVPSNMNAGPGNFSPSPQDGSSVAAEYAARASSRAPLGNYDECIGLKGDLFQASGDILFRAANCLNSNNSNPELASAVNILKSTGRLPVAVKLLNQAINQSPYTVSVLDELETILVKGQMTPLLKMAGIMGEPSRHILDQVDPLVYAVTKNPNAPSVLLWMNWLSSQEKLNDNLITMTDLGFTDPVPVYQSQNGFRLNVTNPVGIKKTISDWNPGASPQTIENIYNGAKENFETHNTDWMYTEGPYKRYTKEEFRTEIVGILNDLLRTTDLEEFIAAFQDFARDRQVFDFLKDLSSKQMVVQNHVGDKTFVHIETGLDALENLVLNSDFGYLYVTNIGVTFQLSVVKSTDFPATMVDQFNQLKMGASAARIFGPKSKYNEFQNMINNFPILDYIAANGEMKVVQRLYRSLYNATPSNHRDDTDPTSNHMGMLFRFHRLGFFQNLSMAIQQTGAQGLSDSVIKTVVDFALKLKPQDIPLVRQSVQILVNQVRVAGDSSVLIRAIDQYWNMQQDPASFEKFKTHLMHLGLAEENYIDKLSLVIKLLPTILNQKNTSMALVDTFFDDLKKDDSTAYRWSANLLRLGKSSGASFKEFISKIMDQPNTGDVLNLASDVYDQNSKSVGILSSELKAYFNDRRVQDLNPQATFRGVLQGLASTGGNGSWPALTFILKDSDSRASLLDLGQTLSAKGQIGSLGALLSRKAASGDAERALHFVFDHFKKESLNLH